MLVPEVKVRIPDSHAIEARLIVLGATFIEQQNLTDTYYKQKADRVLKVSEGIRSELTRLRRGAEGFAIESRERLHSTAETMEQLAGEFGVQRVMRKQRKTFSYKNHRIHLEEFEGLGHFLVIEGAQAKQILTDIGIANPAFIRKPFSEL